MVLLFENGFSGRGQFLQSFCRSTREYVISRVAKPLVIWQIHLCSCKSFAKIVPIPKNYIYKFIYLQVFSTKSNSNFEKRKKENVKKIFPFLYRIWPVTTMWFVEQCTALHLFWQKFRSLNYAAYWLTTMHK